MVAPSSYKSTSILYMLMLYIPYHKVAGRPVPHLLSLAPPPSCFPHAHGVAGRARPVPPPSGTRQARHRTAAGSLTGASRPRGRSQALSQRRVGALVGCARAGSARACWRYGTGEAVEMLAVCLALNLFAPGRQEGGKNAGRGSSGRPWGPTACSRPRLESDPPPSESPAPPNPPP